MTRTALPHPGPESPETHVPFKRIVNGIPTDEPPRPGIEEWIYNALAGMARMDRDPEYRRYIQSRIS